MAKNKAVHPEPAAVEADLARIRTPVLAEREDDHIALLLYAMLDPRRRGVASIQRTLGRPRSSIYASSIRWCWNERIVRSGANADRDAAMLYRELYLHDPAWGRSFVDRIAGTIRPGTWLLLDIGEPRPGGEGPSVAGLADGQGETPDPDVTADDGVQDVQTDATAGIHDDSDGGKNRLDAEPARKPQFARTRNMEEEARLRQEATIKAHKAALEAKRLDEERRKKEQERLTGFYRNGQLLIEAAVSRLAQMMTAKGPNGEPLPVDIKLRDLPKFMEQHRELSELLGTIQPVTSTGPALEPSYRVTLAQSTGGDVLRAMLDDLEEAKTILLSLDARRSAVLAAVAQETHEASGEPQEGRDGREPPDLEVLPGG